MCVEGTQTSKPVSCCRTTATATMTIVIETVKEFRHRVKTQTTLARSDAHLITRQGDAVDTLIDLLDSVLELVDVLGNRNLDLHSRNLAERPEKLLRNREIFDLSIEGFHGADLSIRRNNLGTSPD